MYSIVRLSKCRYSVAFTEKTEIEVDNKTVTVYNTILDKRHLKLNEVIEEYEKLTNE